MVSLSRDVGETSWVLCGVKGQAALVLGFPRGMSGMWPVDDPIPGVCALGPVGLGGVAPGFFLELPVGVGGGKRPYWGTYTDPSTIPRAHAEKMRPPSLALPPGQPPPSADRSTRCLSLRKEQKYSEWLTCFPGGSSACFSHPRW